MALAVEMRAMVVFLVMYISFLRVSIAAVYKVGDSTGWTTIGNFDYKNWSATKTFQLGDIIRFEYNPQFHNVMQVKHPEFQSCNASSPIATHTTGNDSITITAHGHHFFLCGVPGHCQSGQKVDINVRRASSLPPSPSALPSPSIPAASVSPPSPSGTAPLYALNRPLAKLGLSIAVFAAFACGFA
ncbi:unnamed protein product [Ilex paraguariensis]|uniref:Phytocyanin domain-containing protein n=1 Tax=Ilex paraguariensis TaxID=185542 RepID=A0ABC8UZ87_9AQUA